MATALETKTMTAAYYPRADIVRLRCNQESTNTSLNRCNPNLWQSQAVSVFGSQGCIIEHIASFSINSAASWTVRCMFTLLCLTPRFRFGARVSIVTTRPQQLPSQTPQVRSVARSFCDVVLAGYTAKAGWATGAGDVTLRLTGLHDVHSSYVEVVPRRTVRCSSEPHLAMCRDSLRAV